MNYSRYHLLLVCCVVIAVLSVSFAVSSCVALLKAEKLVYSGSIAKKPVSISSSDTLQTVKVETE